MFALAVSLMSIAGPPLFGRFDPGPRIRRQWMTVGAMVIAALMFVLAADLGAVTDVVVSILVGLLTSVFVLQYADVRSAYPPQSPAARCRC